MKDLKLFTIIFLLLITVGCGGGGDSSDDQTDDSATSSDDVATPTLRTDLTCSVIDYSVPQAPFSNVYSFCNPTSGTYMSFKGKYDVEGLWKPVGEDKGHPVLVFPGNALANANIEGIVWDKVINTTTPVTLQYHAGHDPDNRTIYWFMYASTSLHNNQEVIVKSVKNGVTECRIVNQPACRSDGEN